MIQKGDRVDLLDDTLTGVVLHIDEGIVTVETEDGFVMEFPVEKLIKKESFDVDPRSLKKAFQAELKASARKPKHHQKRERETPLEVDLHMGALPASTRNMSDFEVLNYQLDTARQKLEFAIKHHIRRVVFIHGVGRGVLRMELETLLRRYEQVRFYDAEFKRYGRGATEVYIYQNY